ncbi:unnamed protein product, partial [Ectocarpus sp. 8 AP-2014]
RWQPQQCRAVLRRGCDSWPPAALWCPRLPLHQQRSLVEERVLEERGGEQAITTCSRVLWPASLAEESGLPREAAEPTERGPRVGGQERVQCFPLAHHQTLVVWSERHLSAVVLRWRHRALLAFPLCPYANGARVHLSSSSREAWRTCAPYAPAEIVHLDYVSRLDSVVGSRKKMWPCCVEYSGILLCSCLLVCSQRGYSAGRRNTFVWAHRCVCRRQLAEPWLLLLVVSLRCFMYC